MERKSQVKIYHSFEEENEAEYSRRAKMTPEERMQEFAVVQARQWGDDWTEKPMERVATWEWVDWLRGPNLSQDMLDRYGLRPVDRI